MIMNIWACTENAYLGRPIEGPYTIVKQRYTDQTEPMTASEVRTVCSIIDRVPGGIYVTCRNFAINSFFFEIAVLCNQSRRPSQVPRPKRVESTGIVRVYIRTLCVYLTEFSRRCPATLAVARVRRRRQLCSSRPTQNMSVQWGPRCAAVVSIKTGLVTWNSSSGE